MFLFPVTIPEEPYYKRSRYTIKIIYIYRKVENFVNFKINWNMIRDVERIPPNIEPLSDEYFLLLKSNLPVFEFFCHTINQVINLEYCFSACRFQYKRYCDTYIKGMICCRKCVNKCSCKDVEGCKIRKQTLSYMSLYFSELMKRRDILKKMRRGFGYKRNFKGDGPQIYFNVGKLEMIPTMMSYNKLARTNGRKMLKERKCVERRISKETRKLRIERELST